MRRLDDVSKRRGKKPDREEVKRRTFDEGQGRNEVKERRGKIGNLYGKLE